MAKRHDFSYFFHEGLSNMFSHGFMSFAAIGITVACLLIMGTFTLVAVNANELLTTLEQENEILAYVDDSYTETQARALKSRLEAIPNVASVTFISRDEAMEDFKAQYPDEELFQDLDPEILEDRYAIKLVDLEAQSDAGPHRHLRCQPLRGDRRRFCHCAERSHGGMRGTDRHLVRSVGVHHLQHHQAHHL